MEIITKYISAYGKNCYGCKYHEKDVMIEVETENVNSYHDIFLTQEQAITLVESLQKIIKQNQQEN
jgi:hypothetical protein